MFLKLYLLFIVTASAVLHWITPRHLLLRCALAPLMLARCQ